MNDPIDFLFQQVSPHFTLNDEIKAAWSKILEVKTFPKDRIFTKKGDYTQQEVFVIDGLVRGYYEIEDQEKNVSFFHQGQFMTPWHIRTSESRSALNYQFLEETTALVFDQAGFTQMRYQFDSMRKLGEHIVYLELERLRTREQQLLGMNAETRYLAFCQQNPQLIQQLNQYHIASYLNISPVSLSRIRKNS